MHTFHNGRLPEFNERMVQELSGKIAALARRAGQSGMRIDFAWLAEAIGPRLARAVLQRAGFRCLPEQWAIGEGDRRLVNYSHPPVFADKLEEIVDYYED